MARKNTKLKIGSNNIQLDLPDVDGTGKAVIVVDPITNEAGKAVVSLGGGGGVIPGGVVNVTRPGIPNLAVTAKTAVDFIKAYFSPAVPPSVSLNADNAVREFGAATDVQLYYGITQHDNALASIKLGTQPVPFTLFPGNGVTYTGTLSGTANQNAQTDFTLIATTTAGEVATASASVVYKHRRYFFTSADDLLTMDDNHLTAYLLSASSELETSKAQSRTLAVNNEYVYFVYVASEGTAHFNVNGLANTDFTDKTFIYTNVQNYKTNFLITRTGKKVKGTFAYQLY